MRTGSILMAFKLIEEAQNISRYIHALENIQLLLEGIAFKDGEPVQDDRPVPMLPIHDL
jgi:putative transposase